MLHRIGPLILIAFVLFAIQAMWTVYNAYVPDMLARFGVASAALVLLTVEKIIGTFLEPLSGIFSDRTKRKIGRRLPFVLAATPIPVLSMLLVPFPFSKSIAESLGIEPAEVGNLFAPFILFVLVFLIAQSFIRVPVIAFMPDVLPDRLRNVGSAIINIAVLLGGLIAARVSAALISIDVALPFIVSSIVLLVAVAVLIIGLRTAQHPEETKPVTLGPLYPPQVRRFVTFLVVAILFWLLGFNILQVMLNRHLVQNVGINADEAAGLVELMLTAFGIWSVPVGILLDRLGGRRVSIYLGLAVMLGLLLLLLTTGTNAPLSFIMIGFGLAWALINTPALPLLLEVAPKGRNGSYTGFNFIAFSLAGLFTPNLVAGLGGPPTSPPTNLIFLVLISFVLAGLFFAVLGPQPKQAQK